MIEFLLQELEKSAHPTFSKNELLARSSEQFQNLFKKKILAYFRPKEGEAERVNSPRCQHGCALSVVEGQKGLEGVCIDHPGEEPVSLSEDDLNRYELSVAGLLEQIRSSNKIKGRVQSFDGEQYYFGYKMYGKKRIGFVFSLRNKAVLNLVGLKALCDDDDMLVVVAAISKIDDLLLKSILHEKIMQVALVDVPTATLDLRLDELVGGKTQPDPLRIAPLKFGEGHFLEVDALIQDQYQTTAAIEKVANRHGFKVESFKRQYYKRHHPTKRIPTDDLTL